MNAKRSTLADQPVEHQRRVLTDSVVLGKELLKFVNEQKQSRHHDIGVFVSEAGNVLHALLTEQITAFLQDPVEPLQHTEPEFAVTFNRDHSSVGQGVGRVSFKLDALLEVDEIKLNFVRAVVQREIGDEDVHERRFAGTGFAGNEHVLRGSSPEPHVLQLGGSRPAERDVDTGPAVVLPQFLRGDAVEGHFNAPGVF